MKTIEPVTYKVEAYFEGEWLTVDVGLTWAEAVAVVAYHRDHGTEARVPGFCAELRPVPPAGLEAAKEGK